MLKKQHPTHPKAAKLATMDILGHFRHPNTPAPVNIDVLAGPVQFTDDCMSTVSAVQYVQH